MKASSPTAGLVITWLDVATASSLHSGLFCLWPWLSSRDIYLPEGPLACWSPPSLHWNFQVGGTWSLSITKVAPTTCCLWCKNRILPEPARVWLGAGSPPSVWRRLCGSLGSCPSDPTPPKCTFSSETFSFVRKSRGIRDLCVLLSLSLFFKNFEWLHK